jgi:chemotaxis protein methyltransferase WspC
MPPEAILQLLRDRIGLDAESIGPHAVHNAVGRRMAALGLAEPAAYAARAGGDPAELQRLIEAVVVPESWFYRGRGLFEALADRARAVLAARPDGPAFRALSVPCSGGEEPYSLAIAFDGAGLDAARTRILGVDVSADALARARAGAYRDFAFRELPTDLRPRYFRERDGIFTLDPAVRSRVEFRSGNILELGALGPAGPFDLILCRNLLIYLTDAARAAAIAGLRDLLAPGGWLGVGHGEPLPAGHPDFAQVGPPRFLLYARREARPAPSPTPSPAAAPRPLPPKAPARKAPPPPAPAPARPRAAAPAATPPAPPAPAPTLADARRLADAGQVDAALAACANLLRGGGPTADLCCLVGVLEGAKGRAAEAEAALRQALYLDPAHPDALENLMLHLQRRGRHDEARRLRGRLLRHRDDGGAP